MPSTSVEPSHVVTIGSCSPLALISATSTANSSPSRAGKSAATGWIFSSAIFYLYFSAINYFESAPLHLISDEVAHEQNAIAKAAAGLNYAIGSDKEPFVELMEPPAGFEQRTVVLSRCLPAARLRPHYSSDGTLVE